MGCLFGWNLFVLARPRLGVGYRFGSGVRIVLVELEGNCGIAFDQHNAAVIGINSHPIAPNPVADGCAPCSVYCIAAVKRTSINLWARSRNPLG